MVAIPNRINIFEPNHAPNDETFPRGDTISSIRLSAIIPTNIPTENIYGIIPVPLLGT